jgi:hypothetical protein
MRLLGVPEVAGTPFVLERRWQLLLILGRHAPH